MQKQYVEVPLQLDARPWDRLWTLLSVLLLLPFSLVLAAIRRGPGIGMHLRIMRVALKLLILGRLPLKTAASYALFPMDSTRYFEFEAVLRRADRSPFVRYLDVSSPRFAPVLLLQHNPGATALLLNPDASDLDETRKLVSALGLGQRCSFFNGVLKDAAQAPASFDLVTCISVLEHIPQDEAALESMWSMLRPGGRLILTLPCMRTGLEQYISHNQYGVLKPGGDGYTFWQRFYDSERLESRIFRIAGKPVHMAFYGEKRQGLFFRNATQKRLLGSRYPFWQEASMVAGEYRHFSSLADLPGDGVVLLEFEKSPGQETS